MKGYFAHLRPMERRLVIGVGVMLFLVINWWQVWPHFSDWGNLRGRMDTANRKLNLYQTAAAQIPKLQAQVKTFGNEGAVVAPEDQSIDLMRTINSQAAASGVGIQNFSRQIIQTNDAFFVEQSQNITVIATDEQLVDFLYKLGNSASMIRVRDLALKPDAQHYHLTADVKLVASYLKKPAATGKPAEARPPVNSPAPSAPAGVPAKSELPFGGLKRATNSPAKIK
jgi:Tfp pilus assembly protein PilO